MATILLVCMILGGFVIMARGRLSQEVALPIVALGALALSGAPDNQTALQGGFAEFSRILLIFTAVAVPSHLLQRAHALEWVGLLLGEWVGLLIRRVGVPAWFLIPSACLSLAWAVAAGFHNTTSILVCAQIIVVICRSYKLPALPVLSGLLISSNL